MTLEGGDRLYSIGYDQCTRVWSVTRTQQADGFTIELTRVGETLMDVWDLSTIRAVPSALSRSMNGATGPLLIVGGQGLQVIQINA